MALPDVDPELIYKTTIAPEEIGTLAGAPIGTLLLVSTINVAFLLSFPAYTYILAVEEASR